MSSDGPQIERLAVFAAVARSGSFTRAAAEVGMTKSAVSAHVRKLEEQFGVSLLTRTTRHVALTEAGEELRDGGARVLHAVEELRDRMTHARAAPAGRLRITVPVDFAVDILPSVLHRFSRLYPKVRLEVTATDEVVDIVKAGFDVAIRAGSHVSSNLRAITLSGFAQIPCAAPLYFAGLQLPEHPHELIDLAWVSLSALRAPRRWTFIGASGAEVTVELRGTLTVNSGALVRALLVEGAGVSVLPDYLIRRDLREKRLVRLLPSYTLPRRGIYAVLAAERREPARVKAFVEFLRAELRALQA